MRKIALLGVLAAAGVAGVVATRDTAPPCSAAACCRRPPEAPVGACLRIDPLTGVATDFGDSVMPSARAVGDGCVPSECMLGVGIEWLDGGTN